MPENLPYRISGLEAAPLQKDDKPSLARRVLTSEFWHLPFAGEVEVEESSEAASGPGIDVRVVPEKDGCVVRAEGLTHHQAKLVPLHEAQKDVGIKYRSLTRERDDLVDVAYAQRVHEILRGVAEFL